MTTTTIVSSEVIPYNLTNNKANEESKEYNLRAPLQNEKLISETEIPEPDIKEFIEPELNEINVEEENKKDFMYTELFNALFNKYYDNANKLIDMGVKVDYPENNFDETPLGILIKYLDESSDNEKDKINNLIQKLIDKDIKMDYEDDTYNNYKIFKYLSQLILNEKYYKNFIEFVKKYYVKNNILKFNVIKNVIDISNYNILNIIQNNNITIDYEQKRIRKNQKTKNKEDNNCNTNMMKKYYELVEMMNKIKQNNKQELSSLLIYNEEETNEEEIDENDPNYCLDHSLIFSIIKCSSNSNVKFNAYNVLINTGYKLETIDYNELLKYTINYSCLEIFKSLLDKGIKINIDVFNLLLKKLIPSSESVFIQKDIFDLIYNLIETSIKLNDESIDLIIQLDDLKLFYFSIHKFTDFNDNNFEKFIKTAIKSNNKQIIKELIKLGAKLEKESATTYKDSYIYQAILNKNYKLALFLIDNGAKINFNDYKFKDTLLYSVMNSIDLIFYPTIRKEEMIVNIRTDNTITIIPPYDTNDIIEELSSYDFRPSPLQAACSRWWRRTSCAAASCGARRG